MELSKSLFSFLPLLPRYVTHSVLVKSEGALAFAVFTRMTGFPKILQRPISKKIFASVGAGVFSENMATPKPQPRIICIIFSRKSLVPTDRVAFITGWSNLVKQSHTMRSISASIGETLRLLCSIMKAVRGHGLKGPSRTSSDKGEKIRGISWLF